MSKYIRQNTDVYDVILSNKELGFSMNALTGRKLVAQPLGQKNLLYDFNTRDRDLTVMLYANQSANENGLRTELFEKYDVKYFYWDSYWINSEFKVDEQGRMTYVFDPIELLNTPGNKELLDHYEIQYLEQKLELNPNHRGNAPLFDVFMVLPVLNMTHPWHPSLDQFLSLEKEIKTAQGQPVAQLYRVIY